MFEFEGKVVLVTGALGGIGRCFTKVLLQQKVKGIALLDINETLAEDFTKELRSEFQTADLIFIKVDVTNSAQIKDAYEQTVQHFKQLDIVINNVGIICEDDVEKSFQTNLVSAAVSIDLAYGTYLQKYRKGDEAVIINTSSIAALQPYSFMPTYVSSKAALVALGRSLGSQGHYESTKIRILTICPGLTDTPILKSFKKLPKPFLKMAAQADLNSEVQSPEHLADGLIDVIRNGKPGSVWVVNKGKPTKEIDFAEIDQILAKYIE